MKKRLIFCLLFVLLSALTLAARATMVDDGTECPADPFGTAAHNWQLESTQEPDCTHGWIETYRCANCGRGYTLEYGETGGHSYGGYERVEPTCTGYGGTRRVCSVCGDVEELWEREPLGHDPVSVPGRAASCTESGLTEGSVCQRCGETLTEQREIPATGHTPEPIPEKLPTCTEGGIAGGSRCAVCGVTLTEPRPVPAVGHIWDNGIVTAAATCEKEGERTYTCVRCQATRKESIPKADHTPAVLPAVEPTCTEAGKTEGSQCAACGEILTAQQDIPALGHDWDGGVMTLEPTCVKEGKWVSTCTRCGEKQEETVRAVGHTPEAIPGKAATCRETGLTEGSRCAVCGEILEARETLPKTGHAWTEWNTSKQPGCVDPGEQRRACPVCGESETRPLNPLGHAWDEGSVTQEPGLLVEGKITYTCQRCGTVRTEALPTITPQTSLFNLLRDIPPTEEGEEGAADLTIVTQPEGGQMDHEGGSFTLTVEAEGGTPPYTYEWHREYVPPQEMNPGDFATAEPPLVVPVAQAASNLAAKYEKLSQITVNTVINWTPVESVGKKIGEAEPIQAVSVNKYPITGELNFYDPNLFDEVITSGEENSITVTETGTYYCVVKDAAGNEVTSEKAEVGYALWISRQPQSVYSKGQTASFTVGASGGVKPYTYQWKEAAFHDTVGGGYFSESDLQGARNYVFTTKTSGETRQFFCVVTDAAGNSVKSNRAAAFTEPLTVTVDSPKTFTVDDVVFMLISGGVEPVSVSWEKDGEPLAEDYYNDGKSRLRVMEQGVYTCTATDAIGRKASASAMVYGLEISQQPKGGMLSIERKFTLSIRMGSGTNPMSVALYKDGELVGEQKNKLDWEVKEPGEYSFRVTDANGLWAVSDAAVVKPYGDDFDIEYTEKVYLYSSGDTAYLEAKAKGGTAPYIFQWYDHYHNSIDCSVDQGDYQACKAKTLGVYYCTVTEAGGLSRTMRMEVGYKGKKPLILTQPQSVTLPYREDSWYVTELNVTAYSGSGLAGALAYQWEKGGEDGWYCVGFGPKLTLAQEIWDGKVSGWYRCHIIDGQTGGEIYTDEVKVMISLSFAKATGTFAESYRTCNIKYEFEGGTPPYHVQVRQLNFNEIWQEDYGILHFDHFEKGQKEPIDQDYIWIQEGSDRLTVILNGVSRSVSANSRYHSEIITSYYVTVTDAMGQQAEGEFDCESLRR